MLDGEAGLPAIPVVDVGADFPMATLLADEPRAQALFDQAVGRAPAAALRALDRVSRRWLVRSANPMLGEIDAIAKRLGRPGAVFLSVNYEWGCTVRVGPSPDGRSAQLVRTLDWMTHGLGRHVMAAKVAGAAGPFVTLTWPGFTGVMQAMAPGRFSVALNQAPMRPLGGGIYPLDWALGRARVWRSPHQMAGQVVRRVCQTARTFAQAKEMLTKEKIAAPAIFTLAGLAPDEACSIERLEEDAFVCDGAACAGNHWDAPEWKGRARGHDSRGRVASLRDLGPVDFDPGFGWLEAPVLNKLTRLAMVADAAQGRIITRGFEDGRPATRTLSIQV